MAPTTAICFIIASAGLILSARPLSQRAGFLLAMLGSIVAAVGVASWIGFAVGSNDAFGWGVLTRLALLTALSFSALGLGMVALAWNADVQTSWAPSWLPVSLAIGVSTFGVGFWQALIATERSKSALLPAFALGGGFVMAGVVALAVFLAQRAHATALALIEANQQLEEQSIERKRLDDEVDRFFNLSPDLLCFATFEGRFTRVNPSWQRTLGNAADELMAGSFLDLIHPDDRERTVETMQALANGDNVFGFENRYRAKSGEYRLMQWTSTPYLNQRVVYAVARDVTERRRAEAVLQETQLEQMRLKDGFLSHVSHELRSPLTAVYGLVATIADELAAQLNPDQQEYMRIIVKNLRHLEAMIDDLLEVTRAETGKLSLELQSLSLHDAVGDALETARLTATAKNIVLSSSVPDRMPLVYADPSRMQQILTNLINNAVKFTPAHGSVQVQARVRETDPTRLVVEVSDTGCGISPADAGRIFERLYQVGENGHANRTGLGLGLDICKQLVERQGGQIWVTSEVLKGSTFSFTVPLATRAVFTAA